MTQQIHWLQEQRQHDMCLKVNRLIECAVNIIEKKEEQENISVSK